MYNEILTLLFTADEKSVEPAFAADECTLHGCYLRLTFRFGRRCFCPRARSACLLISFLRFGASPQVLNKFYLHFTWSL
ncbi:hypothetical protein HMPREF3192_00093 [Atopobium deltae]|uniref:Uncharacterized protein n=1 Tax=Atopobium deltae TaxID=1393034 RepID=A0A133XXM0_9ACTN|nr:hypothetical protein HMPREF3192_00093 [Atopobium deltae]